jgi:hypothetical protein
LIVINFLENDLVANNVFQNDISFSSFGNLPLITLDGLSGIIYLFRWTSMFVLVVFFCDRFLIVPEVIEIRNIFVCESEGMLSKVILLSSAT